MSGLRLPSTMPVDLPAMPWWAALLLLLIGGALFLALSTALWGAVLWCAFRRWWSALITVALVVTGFVLGVPARLWEVVAEGWGQNGWITFAVLTTVGIPIAVFLGAMGVVNFAAGGRRLRTGPRQDPVPTHHFADYGSEAQQWVRELARRDRS